MRSRLWRVLPGPGILCLLVLTATLTATQLPAHTVREASPSHLDLTLAAASPTRVQSWPTAPTTLPAGTTLSAPVRIWTSSHARTRTVRIETRRPGGTWTAAPARRTGPAGRITARWTTSSRTEGTWQVRLRVLPLNTTHRRHPGALTPARTVTVRRAATPTQATQLITAFNNARTRGRYCDNTWYPAQPPLKAHPDLRVAAQHYAEDLATRDYFSHTGHDGSQPQDRARRAGYTADVGENLAAGQATPAATIQAWLDSPGHCVNIMWPHYRTIGAGFSPRVADSTYQTYWVTNLGTR